MKIIDLSMFIDTKTPVFPGSPKTKIETLATIEKDGWNELSLNFTTHFSTHIDAPLHMLANGKNLSDYPIEKFIGETIVIDCMDQNKININKSDLAKIKANDIVFLYTGHSNDYLSEKYFSNQPVISIEATKALIAKKIRIIGIDFPSPDKEPFDVHKLFFKNDIMIVENLVNLSSLVNKRFKSIIAPLKISNADGAPCRVIAILD